MFIFREKNILKLIHGMVKRTNFARERFHMLCERLTMFIIVVSILSGFLFYPTDCLSQKKSGRIIMNDDGQVIAEAPEENPIPFIKSWLDRESDFIPFTTFVFLAAMPDICFYDTKVGEEYGKRFGDTFDEWYAPAMRGLKKEGTDPLKLVAKHMKSKGYEVLAAIRMGDTHHRKLDHKEPLCPEFAIDHPEYVIKQPDARTNETALDYSYPEVREHRFAIMKEVVSEYNIDGLELDFVRWGKFFPRNMGREKAYIMTTFLERIRDMMDVEARKKGCDRLRIGVRIPESVDACWLAGIDIKTWVEKGLVDYVVVSTWNNTDPQLPVDQFTTFTKPAGVETYAMMGNMIGAFWDGLPNIYNRGIAMSTKHKTKSYHSMLITKAEARAAAANYYAWGADGIYFWNVGIQFGNKQGASPEQRERIKRWTQVVCNPQKVYGGMRWYHYLPMGKGIEDYKPPLRNYAWYDEGSSVLGHENNPTITFADENMGERQVFPFRMADGRNGEKLKGTLEFNIYHATKTDSIDIDINGKMLDLNKVMRADIDPKSGLPGIHFEIELQDCPEFIGDNELGLTITTKEEGNKNPYMEELEIFVH
jgi:hypothetical protein